MPDFEVHIEQKNNPHRVSKDQVGLGQVENLPVASQALIEAGESDEAYVTSDQFETALKSRLRAHGIFDEDNHLILPEFSPSIETIDIQLYSESRTLEFVIKGEMNHIAKIRIKTFTLDETFTFYNTSNAREWIIPLSQLTLVPDTFYEAQIHTLAYNHTVSSTHFYYFGAEENNIYEAKPFVINQLNQPNTWVKLASGGEGVHIAHWSLSQVPKGSQIDFKIDALSAPDRFIVESPQGLLLLDTGWRGGSHYESNPIYDGGISGPGAATFLDLMTKDTQETLTVKTIGLASGTQWSYWFRYQ